MTKDQIVHLCERYAETFRQVLRVYGTQGPARLSNEDLANEPVRLPTAHRFAHYWWMCLQIEGFIEEGKSDKAMRWLGFLQGVLFSEVNYSIDDLKDGNRTLDEMQ